MDKVFGVFAGRGGGWNFQPGEEKLVATYKSREKAEERYKELQENGLRGWEFYSVREIEASD